VKGKTPFDLSNMRLGYRRKGSALFTRETHFGLLAWHRGVF
jgi:hypothetical protein